MDLSNRHETATSKNYQKPRLKISLRLGRANPDDVEYCDIISAAQQLSRALNISMAEFFSRTLLLWLYANHEGPEINGLLAEAYDYQYFTHGPPKTFLNGVLWNEDKFLVVEPLLLRHLKVKKI